MLRRRMSIRKDLTSILSHHFLKTLFSHGSFGRLGNVHEAPSTGLFDSFEMEDVVGSAGAENEEDEGWRTLETST